MRKFLVVMMVLTVAMGLFAVGYGNPDRQPLMGQAYMHKHPEPQFGVPGPERERARLERGFGYGLRLQLRDEEQMELMFKTRIAETINQLDLSDEQLNEIYETTKETKETIDSLREKSEQLLQEYYNALVERDEKEAKDLKDQMWDLKDEIRDAYREFVEKIDDIITIDQYRRFRGIEKMLFVLLTDEGFEVLEEMVQR
ncbi:hypothetical protein [Thermotoga sp. KOL6]|uniref:hypothetical protein n=1 Tax=Thermotoga sp. KOL6 TaxID=126741 RepID=UPI000C75C88F|nr:hypothetical protein [Thermotoga sp. KOL6]PLV60128.1 hypothetical protein AS005_02220 [Thermotoga sp. KOL6]